MQTSKPKLSIAFYVLGWLVIAGAISQFGPMLVSAIQNKVDDSAYINLIGGALCLGITEGLLFFVIAEGLAYLNDIKQGIMQLQNKLTVISEIREHDK